MLVVILECSQLLELYDSVSKTCVSECSFGKYYDQSSRYCLQCPSNCQRCDGPAYGDCQLCSANFYKNVNSQQWYVQGGNRDCVLAPTPTNQESEGSQESQGSQGSSDDSGSSDNSSNSSSSGDSNNSNNSQNSDNSDSSSTQSNPSISFSSTLNDSTTNDVIIQFNQRLKISSIYLKQTRNLQQSSAKMHTQRALKQTILQQISINSDNSDRSISFSHTILSLDFNQTDTSTSKIYIKLTISNSIRIFQEYKLYLKFQENAFTYLNSTKFALMTQSIIVTLNPQESQDAIIDTQRLKQSTQSASYAAQSIVGANIILAVTMDFSLKYLWSAVNTVQMIEFLPLLCGPMPLNTQTVFLTMGFANGDFYIVKKLTPSIRSVLGIDLDNLNHNPLDLCFEENDFGSQAFFLNYESKVYLMAIYLVVFIPIACLITLVLLGIKWYLF